MKALAPALLLAAVAGCATLPACPAEGGTPWRELETRHFVLRTNLDGADAAALMRTLEETRAALLAAVWPNSPDPPGQTHVVAIDSVKETFAYFPDNVRGLWHAIPPFPPTVLLGPRWRHEGFDTFAHELAHELSFHSLPLQPTWYAEGVATFVETLSYDPETHTVTTGAPPMQRLLGVRSRSIHASLLIPAEEMPADVDGALFESYSWLLFRYLVDHDPAGLARFQDLIRAVIPSETAWRSAFPTLTFQRVDEVLADYKSSERWRQFRRPVVVPPYTVKERPLSDATVHAQRAFLLHAHHPTEERLRLAIPAELDEAFAQERDNVEALALVFVRTEDAAERKRLAARAIAANPSSALAAVMRADTLEPHDPAARTALVHALAAAPHAREVMWRLARAEAARGEWPAARRFAEQALRLGGANNRTLLELFAETLAHTGSCTEAAFVMDRIGQHLTGAEGAKADALGAALNALCSQRAPAGSAPPAPAAAPGSDAGGS